MNKKKLSERDICSKFITPALQEAGWDLFKQIREEFTFTEGRIIDRGSLHKRGRKRRADYLLFYKPNLPIAVVEAKDNKHSVGEGMQQALDYAETLDVPFAYSSNGDGFIEHDKTGGEAVERELSLSEFPSPEQLWQRYKRFRGLSTEDEAVVLQDYFSEVGGKEPRYYQRIAINRVVEAVAKGRRRLLLVMATGTGKTYVAFQILWRLWKAGKAKRILFLADRNILVDQARINDFRPFGDKITKIQRKEADKSYELYLGLYQSLTGPEPSQKTYREYSPDFFDLIVIDECHRGSAAEDSQWREILEYFEDAIQLGLTATPKETKYVSNIDYFGDPVYTYSLKQGIEDGFLAPYRVVRVGIDKDLEGWRPEHGTRDKTGQIVEDRIYNRKDFDRTLVIDERTQLVAKKVASYLESTDRLAKTIVFCIDIDHAERMRRALANESADLVSQNHRYVMRITGDSEEGLRELDNFIDPEKTHPVIATTSKLLTTGVDVQTCKLIVLDANIGSMTEFKQIIGRGTRIREDYGKRSFTIMDFRGVTNHFADPDFDGEPVQIYEPLEGEAIVPPEPEGADDAGTESLVNDWFDEEAEGRVKYRVQGVPVRVVNERVQYYGSDGRLITESLKDYTRKNVHQQYASLDDFLRSWNQAERKEAIIEALVEQGVLLDALEEEVGKDFDPFDLVCHVAFDQPPLTRRERAENVRKRDYFTRHGEEARRVLEALLEKYADEGIEQIERMDVLKVKPLSDIGSPLDIVRGIFGGKKHYLEAVEELERQLYLAA